MIIRYQCGKQVLIADNHSYTLVISKIVVAAL